MAGYLPSELRLPKRSRARRHVSRLTRTSPLRRVPELASNNRPIYSQRVAQSNKPMQRGQRNSHANYPRRFVAVRGCNEGRLDCNAGLTEDSHYVAHIRHRPKVRESIKSAQSSCNKS
jgi:hypothetical protein